MSNCTDPTVTQWLTVPSTPQVELEEPGKRTVGHLTLRTDGGAGGWCAVGAESPSGKMSTFCDGEPYKGALSRELHASDREGRAVLCVLPQGSHQKETEVTARARHHGEGLPGVGCLEATMGHGHMWPNAESRPTPESASVCDP